MTFEEFEETVARAEQQRKPPPPEVDVGLDPTATDTDIARAEHDLGRKLPTDYRRFLQRYGGGYFHFAVVFSVAPGSEWNVVTAQKWVKARPDFLAISDDEAGGFYGYADGTDRIFYWYPSEEGPPRAGFANLFDFLAETALRIR